MAGAPVTDWMWYDTGYTERYLGVPPDTERYLGIPPDANKVPVLIVIFSLSLSLTHSPPHSLSLIL